MYGKYTYGLTQRRNTCFYVSLYRGTYPQTWVSPDMAAVVARACEGLATRITELTYSLVYSLPYFG